MTVRVVGLARGLVETLDERLAPDGADLEAHFILALQAVAEADRAVSAVDQSPSAFNTESPARQASDMNYALLEAARLLFSLAIRLRSRATGQPFAVATLPLSQGLDLLSRASEDLEIELAQTARSFGEIFRTLAHASPALAGADHYARDPVICAAICAASERIVQHSVLPLLQIAALAQDST